MTKEVGYKIIVVVDGTEVLVCSHYTLEMATLKAMLKVAMLNLCGCQDNGLS